MSCRPALYPNYSAFGKRSVELEMQVWAPEGHDPLAEDISATLDSIRRRIEEGSGKVETHPTDYKGLVVVKLPNCEQGAFGRLGPDGAVCCPQG